MRSARRSAVRLLQLMLVASIVLPLMLFFFAGWVNYRNERSIADERIERSLDILHEHTLKVFQTVERSIAEVNEIARDAGRGNPRTAAAPARADQAHRRALTPAPRHPSY